MDRKIKYAIVEDEPLAAEKLQQRMQRLRPDWDLVGIWPTVREIQRHLPQSKPELLLLDIHLGDDLSINLFEQLDYNGKIIFTTAYDQYAIKAFKLNGIDYLLKPFSENELNDALNRFDQRSSQVADFSSLKKLLQPSYKERFMISTGTRIKSVSSSEIAFFYASGKHSFLYTLSGDEYLVDLSLNKLIEELDPQRFFKINRQFIVHIDSIRELIPYSKGRLKLVTHPSTPEEAVVSVEKSPGFKEWLGA